MGRNITKDSTSTILANQVGDWTVVRAFTRIEQDACVGRYCKIGNYCRILRSAWLGSHVEIEDYVTVPGSVRIEDGVLLGAHVTFVEGGHPTAAACAPTLIGKGARIGARTTLLGGVSVGRYAQTDPGTLITEDVPDHAHITVSGSKQSGWVCVCGKELALPLQGERFITCACARSYRLSEGHLTKVTQLGD